MNTENKYLHQEVTSKIISAFYNVYNNLGFGFLEKVYENINVGKYFADLLVEEKVIL